MLRRPAHCQTHAVLNHERDVHLRESAAAKTWGNMSDSTVVVNADIPVIFQLQAGGLEDHLLAFGPPAAAIGGATGLPAQQHPCIRAMGQHSSLFPVQL